MADEADQAQDSIDLALSAAIARARETGIAPELQGLPVTGFCAWCGDPVQPGHRHCRPMDNDCEATHLRYIRYGRGNKL